MDSVVWAADDGFDTEVFLWESGSVQKLTDDDHNDGDPSISGSLVVWSGVNPADAGLDRESFYTLLPEPDPAWQAGVAAALLVLLAARRFRRSHYRDDVIPMPVTTAEIRRLLVRILDLGAAVFPGREQLEKPATHRQVTSSAKKWSKTLRVGLLRGSTSGLRI